MLKKYLQGAVEDLHELIKLTFDDIHDIKAGEHTSIFSRVSLKEKLIGTFEAKKRMIDEISLKRHLIKKSLFKIF
jgi:hypothetical protein